MRTSIRFGVDRVCANPAMLSGAGRVGLVTNDAARVASDSTRRSREVLIEAGIRLVRLFGPEHGLSATAADGLSVPDEVDACTGLPVVSLYGERVRPTVASLRDLDAVLFDIPDVGVRFYTYTWTLYHVLAACEEAGVLMVVLDRPNPLGGELLLAEGPMLDMAYRSFVGEDRIPIRHQLTLGELALLWQREQFPRAVLRIIPCEGWRRTMQWPDTGLPWVATSPAMPSFDSARCYPGLCLFEATNLSVGRGTDRPFQLVGAPWLQAARVVQRLALLAPGSVDCTVETFTPGLGPYAGQSCEGVSVRVADAETGATGIVAIGLLLLAAIVGTHHEQFQWAAYPTAANPSGADHFERLIGRRDIRAVFDATPDAINLEMVRQWTMIDGWSERVRDVLCYT